MTDGPGVAYMNSRRTACIRHAVAWFAWLICAAHSSAQNMSVHRLTFAAHPENQFSNREADAYVAEMNRIMAAQSYPWDVACPQVQFVRQGDVISDRRLLVSGTITQFTNNLKQVAPQTSVLV